MTKLVFKYWQFIFECYSSVLALNVDCSPKLYMWESAANNNCTDSNLETWEVTVYKWFIISWSNTDLWICVHWLHTRLQLLRSNEGYHELHGDSQNTNICYSCCLHSHLYKLYLIQEKHKFQAKKSIGNWFLNPVIPACYFPFEGKVIVWL